MPLLRGEDNFVVEYKLKDTILVLYVVGGGAPVRKDAGGTIAPVVAFNEDVGIGAGADLRRTAQGHDRVRLEARCQRHQPLASLLHHRISL